MKKIFNIILCVCLLSTIFIINVAAKANFDLIDKESTDLGYGITLEKITGKSTSGFNSLTVNPRFQAIYTATFKPGTDVKVVQWSPLRDSENSWMNTTLEKIAADYERNHPDEKVIVATNNWLSTPTGGNIGELDSVQSVEGLNLRVSDKLGNAMFGYHDRPNFIGFTKDGKHVIFSDDFQEDDVNDYMSVYYYNDEDFSKELTDVRITKINQLPSEGEVSIYFKNYNGNDDFTGCKIYRFDGNILRHDIFKNSVSVERDAFALGKYWKEVSSFDFEPAVEDVYDEDGKLVGEERHNYPYYFVSRNSKFENLDFTKKILCQYDFKEEFKDAYGVTTYYYHIVRDGIGWEFNNPEIPWAMDHQINCEVHPRTAFIIKQDGTFCLSVIDGRGNGETQGIGMDYEDMANFYIKYYNAKEAFNYDGGGSSCMVVANQNGGFDIVNRPSDGSERPVANASLFVVKKYDVEVHQSDISENSISVAANNSDERISKIFVSLNGIKKEIVNGNATFDNLNPTTIYTASFSYVIDGIEVPGKAIKVNTDAPHPNVINFDTLEATLNSIEFAFGIEDKAENYIDGYVYVDGAKHSFVGKSIDMIFEDLLPGTTYDVEIYLNYQDTTKTSVCHEIYKVKTLDPPYPLSISLGEPSIDLNINDSYKLEITKTPSNTKTTYTYSSSDESVATVNDKGRISAISEGIATITVTTLEGVSASIDVIVTDPNKAPAKTGCNSGALIISLISLTSLLFILRKKK